jgi:hypothetical protein
MGYAVFDGETVAKLGIKVQKILGATPDAVVNTLHYDIQELTGQQLNAFAEIIGDGEIKEILAKQVRQRLQDELNTGHLDRQHVNQKLLDELLKN